MTFTPLFAVSVLIPVLAVLLALTIWQALRQRRSPHARDWAARVLLVLLVVVVAFRPSLGGGAPSSSAEGGLEVYFVVDTTSSMVAEDYGSTDAPRLSGVRADISAIAQELTGAEFALITFDSTALQRMPLTSDLTALRSAVTVMTQEVTGFSSGSSIDAPKDLLDQVLADAAELRPDRPRVVYYFGDGEQTAETEPGSFESIAADITGGAVLGYGTEDGGRMLSFDGYNDEYSEPAGYIQDFSLSPPADAISRIDEENLNTIAEQLGVGYDRREVGDTIAALTAGIEVDSARITQDQGRAPFELYWIAAVGIAALLFREGFQLLPALRDAGFRGGKR
jgi:Ca-activated chloride channel family protein